MGISGNTSCLVLTRPLGVFGGGLGFALPWRKELLYYLEGQKKGEVSMDKVTFIVLFNMTAALVIAGFVTWLFHTGRWPKNSKSDKE